jgi:putative tricarboxylic transport membrane protein
MILTTQLKRALATAALAAAIAPSAGGSALANDDYPNRSIEVIHQYGPGGGTDRFIRAVAQPFEEVTGAAMVPISVQGGGGIPAVANFLQRPSDGYTLFATGPDQVIAHVLGRIDMAEFMPLARIQYDQGLFMVPADSPYETIQDFIDDAKANPGKIKVGITGAAGFDDTLVGLWNLESGAEVTTVPFGSSEMVSNTLGGQVDAMYEEYGPARGLIESGDLRPLVVFSDERLPVLPDVPTAKELGYDVTLGRWRSVSMHHDAEPAHADKLADALREAVLDEGYKDFEEKSALQYRSVFLGPKEFKAFVEREIETYTKVLTELGYVN